jgi:hypothetical protein
MLENESKERPNKLKFSIWDTRTEENIDDTKEKIAEAMEHSELESKATNLRD